MFTLHTERIGEGKPVLVLHGLMSDHRQVQPLLPALEGRTVIFVDLLGCGKSPEDAEPSVIFDNVEALRALCKRENIDTVIGYSISGLIALELQLPHTILISTFCQNPFTAGHLLPLHGHEPLIKQELVRHRGAAQRFIRKYLKQEGDVPGIKQASLDTAIQYMFLAEHDNTDKARTLKHALVIHGTKDLLIHHELGMRLATAAGAAFVAVPEDHASVLRNETVHGVIRNFLRDRPRHAKTR